MKNKLNYLVMLFCIPAVLFAQTKNKQQTFQEIKNEREAYFAKQLKERGRAYLQQEGGEYSQYQNWLDIWEPRIGPVNGTVEDYITRLTQSVNNNTQAKNGAVTALTSITDPWKELGPIQTPTIGLASIGGGAKGIGPIQYITFYKPDPNRILASSLSGGLFYSGNKGNSWKNAGSDKWTLSGCISAAFSPVDSNTWYGCSHIGGGWNRHSPERNFAIGPGGVWRTTNKGVDYTLIASANTFTVLAEQTTIHKILIDPNNAAVGYVATTGGLYKSININAATPAWFLIRPGNVEDVELKTDNSAVIFIALQTTFAPGTSGYSQTNTWAMEVSTSWGGTAITGIWTSIPAPSGGFIANQSIPPRPEPGNLEMTVTEADANLIYVQDAQYNGPTENIYTYNYGTHVWILRRTLNSLTHGLGRAFGVSNVNASIVYIGDYIYLYKSTNYGAPPTGGDGWIDPTSTATPYKTDIEYVVAPPKSCSSCSTDVFIANHGGVSYSSNACSTIVAKSSGLGVAEIFTNISQSNSNGKKMVAGVYHGGSIMSDPVTGGEPWQTVNDGDGDGSVIDQSNDNNVWTSGNTFGGPGFQYSNTGGAAGTYNVSTVMSNAYTRSVVQNTTAPNYFYFKSSSAGYDQVFRSNDNGVNNSEQITNFTAPTYTSSNLNHITSSPSNANYVYIDVVLSGDGVHHLMRNVNVNAAAAAVQTSWQNLSFALPGAPWYKDGLGRFVVDCYNPNIVYLTFYGGFVWKADYSNTSSPVFTNMTGNLPSNPTPDKIIMERGSNGGLYMCSDMGVYYTNNDYQSTGSWVEIGVLPHVSKNALEINYNTNKLRIGLSGRGIWEHDLVCPAQDILPLDNMGIAPRFFEANYINSTNSLTTSNAATLFRATHAITLNPNFIADAVPGGSFLAFIHGCSSPGSSFPVKNDGDEIQFSTTDEDDEEEQESNEENSIRALPNPSNGLLTLAFSNDHVKNVFIYDMTGKAVFKSENVKGKTLQVDITDQQAGIYLVKVISGDKTVSKKIIKQ